MNDKIRKEIANVLSVRDYDAEEQLENAIDSNGNPATKNSVHMFGWDVRYTKIRDIGIKNELKAIIINRGELWKLVALVDEKREEISLFMSEKNLQKVRDEKKPRHYMSILSFLNKEEPLQTSLEVGESQYTELTEELFTEMMNEYEINAKRTYVYSFSNTYGQEQFMMYRFDSEYKLIEHKDYSDLIDSTFESDTIDKVDVESKESTTVGKLKEQENQIVSLKND